MLLAFVAIVRFASAQDCCGSATCPHSKQAKDKTIVPFATSGGSSIKQACNDLKAAYPKYKFGEGKLLNKIDKAVTAPQ